MTRIEIHNIKKHFYSGTHRVRSPEATLSEIEPLMEKIGVTEVRDITGLDRLGIPVFSAIRPSAARGAVSVHAGKGIDPLNARVSAMMEAIERFSAEKPQCMEFASYEEIGLTRAVDPRDLILPQPLAMGEKLQWISSWDILNDEEVYLPANAVLHPYNSQGIGTQIFRSDTNGLASGNVMEEAILHALFEVVERDALSCAEQGRSLGKRLRVDSGPVRELLDIFENQGVAIHLWLTDGKTRLPTVAAAADDTVTKDPGLLVIGCGTHASPEIAALRAITEVAQSRASYLEGGRSTENRKMILEKAGYERLKRINSMWFADAPEVNISDVPDLSTDSLDGDIRAVLDEVKVHADRVCISDLSVTPVPVVRAVIPGFEISYMDPTRVRRD